MRVPVYLTPEQHGAISEKAAGAGLPISIFLSQAALRRRIVSAVDRGLVKEIGKISADQGRLGGLLKLWLTREDADLGEGIARADILSLFREIRDTQGKLLELVAAGAAAASDREAD